MKLDYDLTIIDIQVEARCGSGLSEHGLARTGARRRRCSIATSTRTRGPADAHDLCAHYGVELDTRTMRRPTPSRRCGWSSPWRSARGATGVRAGAPARGTDRLAPAWAQDCDEVAPHRKARAPRPARLRLAGGSGGPRRPPPERRLESATSEQVPHHVDALVLGEHDLGRMLLVDVADQAVVDGVADELLEAAGERLDQRGRDRRAAGSPAGGCSRRSSSWRCPPGAGRCGWHRRRARGSRPTRARCPSAFRPGWCRSARGGWGLVVRGGCPGTSRVAPFSSVKSVMAHMVLQMMGTWGLGQRDELVVGVDRLRLLVGADGNGGERRDEQSRIEHPPRPPAARWGGPGSF